MMHEEYEIEGLSYRDPRQTFAQQVASCPPFMSVREAVQNAIEAATDADFLSRYGPGAGRIEFTCTAGEDIEDGFAGRKFGVLSYGRWMTWPELVAYTDIGAGAKPRGLHINYGIGMKLAGLAASPAGVVIRTYNPDYRPAGLDPDDCVAEVILAGRVDEGGEMVYGRLRLCPESVDNPCLRVRSRNELPGRDWSAPWTEVVFVGTEVTDDTVNGFFGTAVGLYGNQFWSMAAVNCRYYMLPDGLEVRHANISQSNSADVHKNARGLRWHVVERWSQPEDGGNHSVVNTSHPVFGRCLITYGLLVDGASCNSTLQASGVPTENRGNGHASLVYHGEIYDHRFGKLWGSMASKFGLPHGQKRLYVHIELLDELFQPTQDRTRLRVRRRVGLPDCEVYLEDFAELVRNPDSMPEWVKEYMDRVSRGAIRSESLHDELRRLIEQLQAQEKFKHRAKPDPDGEEMEVPDLPGGGNGGRGPGPKRGDEPPVKRKKGKGVPIQMPQPPSVLWVTIDGSEGHFTNERQGAHFDKDANILRMNLEYRGFLNHLHRLQKEEGAEDEDSRSRIEAALRDEYGLRVASHIISAFHNRNARVIDPATLNAIFEPANFICLMTTFDSVIVMGFHERYRRLMRQVQHG